MKKALIVANLAGFASFLLSDVDTLQSMGYQVFYAANTEVLPWDDTKLQLENRNVRIVHIDFDSKNPFSKLNIMAYRQLKCLLQEDSFDLIHCHTPISGLLTRLAARKYRKYGTKVVYTTHGLSFTTQSSWKTKLIYGTIENIGARLCDAIITINQEDFETAKKMHCRQTHYIHGVGVDIGKYANVSINRCAYRSSIGVAEDEIMVLSVGELSARKNHKVIIDALSKIPSGKKYVYVICGNGIDGGTGKLLQKEAKEKNIRLILLGFRHDIPQIMHCSDVGAIPSVREGLGLAGVQSLAAGVPVVGTAVQGIKDYIVDGKTGFAYGAYDADGFAQGIETLVSLDTAARKQMAVNCIEKAYCFDINISREEMRQIYQGLLAAD